MRTHNELVYYKKQEPYRKIFQNIFERMQHEVKFNLEVRSETLAPKDIKLLKKTHASLIYLSSLYETDWKICLPRLVVKYVDVMAAMFEENSLDWEEENLPQKKEFLSICDVITILEYTDDVIHYIITEFDPGAFRHRRSLLSRFSAYMNSARTVSETRQKIATSVSEIN